MALTIMQRVVLVPNERLHPMLRDVIWNVLAEWSGTRGGEPFHLVWLADSDPMIARVITVERHMISLVS